MSIIGHIVGGHYQVLNFLGKGGFGETYLAKDLHLPDTPLRVIKRLQSHFSPNEFPTVKKWFDREAQTLYKLNHDRIPKLFAHFEENQNFYLVQEYVDGYDLRKEIVPGQQLSEAEVIELLEEILKILKFVHQQKIIHRDIKPSNLMRRASDGKIILIDFGAVKEITSQITNIQGQEMSRFAIESPGYTPIEQKDKNPQFCSDIYALGIVAIQALTGLDPTEFSKDSHTSEIIWRDTVSVSSKLATIIDKMVRTNFRDRYQSTDEVLCDLSSATKQKKPFNPLVGFLTAGVIGLMILGVLSVLPLVQAQLENNLDSPKPTIEW